MQKSNKVREAQCPLNTQTKVVQESRSRESELKVGNQRNLITTQMRPTTTETLKVNQSILKKRLDGGPFLIEAGANCHMALKTSVVPMSPAHMVATSLKSSNSEETEMHMHWTISIQELRILILVKKSGNKRTTMKDCRLKLS